MLRTPVCFRILTSSLTSVSIFSVCCYSILSISVVLIYCRQFLFSKTHLYHVVYSVRIGFSCFCMGIHMNRLSLGKQSVCMSTSKKEQFHSSATRCCKDVHLFLKAAVKNIFAFQQARPRTLKYMDVPHSPQQTGKLEPKVRDEISFLQGGKKSIF